MTLEASEILIKIDYYFDFGKCATKFGSGMYLIDTKVGLLSTSQIAVVGGRSRGVVTYTNFDVNRFWELDLIGIKSIENKTEH